MTGTVLNVIAVLIGGSIGTFFGNRLPAKVQETVLHGLGLMVLAIGVIMASGTSNVLIPLVSVVAGGILGEFLRIDDGLNWLGEKAPKRSALGRAAGPGQSGGLGASRGLLSLPA